MLAGTLRDSPLQTVRIHSYSCFSRLSSFFLQLRKLQGVCLPEAGLIVLPDGMWLRQLKVLDLSRNAFRRIPPILTRYKAMLQKLNLQGALVKRAAPSSSNEDLLSTDDCASLNSNEDACSSSNEDDVATDEEETCSASDSIVCAANIEGFLYLFDNVFEERVAADRHDKAFSAAVCQAVRQQLLDAGVDVQVDEAALSDNFTRWCVHACAISYPILFNTNHNSTLSIWANHTCRKNMQ